MAVDHLMGTVQGAGEHGPVQRDASQEGRPRQGVPCSHGHPRPGHQSQQRCNLVTVHKYHNILDN